MSVYHQSVYNGLTEHGQQSAFGVLSRSADSECVEKEGPGVSGYYLCNRVYASSVFSLLCGVIRRRDSRFVTIQCCVYILKYLLTNHIYGDYLPFEFFQELAETYWCLSEWTVD